MTDLSKIKTPTLHWLARRTDHAITGSEPGWILRDPVVGILAPMLHLLEKAGETALDEKTRQGCADAYWENKARWVGWENNIRKAVEAFNQVGIIVIPLKGAALQGTLYKDIGLRGMSDVDVLVRPEEFLQAISTLKAMGWPAIGENKIEDVTWFKKVPMEFWPKEVSFQGPAGLVFEMHQNLIPPWYIPNFPVDIKKAWERSISVADGIQLEGKQIPWKKRLDAYDTLAFLCLHQVMHGLKFMQAYMDVDQWIRNLPEGWNWDSFIDVVSEWRIRSGAYHTLSISREFMATPLPDGLLERLDPGRAARSRVRLLITGESILMDTSTPGSRHPILVRLALADKIWYAIRTLLKSAFPNRTYYQFHPSRKSLLANWAYVIRSIIHGN